MPEKVIELFANIPVEEIDEVIMTLLFNACAKVANTDAVQLGNNVLNRLPKSFLQHQKLVNSAINMLMKFGDTVNAKHLFHKIQNKTFITFAAMIQGLIDDTIDFLSYKRTCHFRLCSQ